MRFLRYIWPLLFSLSAAGQDVHFSQFFVSPLLQNPANTGYFNCDYRFTAIYKSQWSSVTVPYTTFAASYDMRFIRKHKDSREIKTTKDILGGGLVFLNDRSGDGAFTRPYVGLAGSYHKCLDRYGLNYIGLGVMLGYGAGIVDNSKLVFDDQYPGYTGGPLLPTQEPYFHDFSYFDASAGLEYNWLTKKRDKHLQLGIAVFHINQPEQSFFGDPLSRLPAKLVIHGSFQVKLSEKFELYPKAQITYQGTSSEYLAGTFLRVNLSDEKDYGVYLGSWIRVGDAVIAVARFDVSSISFSFSYDINTSSLTQVSDGRGGPELSIIYIGCLPKNPSKAVFCPRF